VEGALKTIDGYEAMHVIRKGQIRWLARGDVSVANYKSALNSGAF
jgi:hypothetical protein